MKLEQLGNVSEARRALQVSKRDSEEKIFINYRGMVTQNVIPEGHTEESLTHSKILLIAAKHSKEVEQQNHFSVKCPYKDACSRCSGTGALYKLAVEEIKTEEKDCQSCNGKGHIWIPCRKCNGTGRFLRTNKADDLRINVKCEACAKFEQEWDLEGVPHFSYRVRCRDCRGEQKKSRYTGIATITVCPKCHGHGFPLKKVWNPAVPFTLADKIEDVEVEDEATPVVDRVSDLKNSNQALIDQLFADEV